MPSAIDLRGVFSGIEKAKSRVSANYVRPGRYWAKLSRVKVDKNRTGRTFVAIEMQVARVLDDDEGRGHRIGENITHLMMTDQDSFMGNMKAFISAVLDVPESDINTDEAVEIAGDDNPLENTICELSARTIQTRAGNPFTEINYLREVPAIEFSQWAGDNIELSQVQTLFPGDTLDRLIEGAGGADE
jgi:hypothetical protein